jgi:hypothetical protein
MRKIDRFLQYLDYKGISENKATVDCSLSKGLIGQAKSGKSDLGNKATEKVLSFYQDLSRVWLLTGEGSMIVCSEEINQPQNPMEEQPEERNTMIDSLLTLVESQRRDIETLIQMAQEKDKRIDELTQDVMELQQENNLLKMDSIMLTPNGLGNARDVEDSLSASAI